MSGFGKAVRSSSRPNLLKPTVVTDSMGTVVSSPSPPPPPPTQEIMDESLDTTEEDDASESIDECFETITREEVRAWLTEFGPKLFSLGLSQWLVKEDKKQQKTPSKTSRSKSLEPAKKKRRVL